MREITKTLKKRSERCYHLNMSWIHTPDWHDLVLEMATWNFETGKSEEEKVTRWKSDKEPRWKGDNVKLWRSAVGTMLIPLVSPPKKINAFETRELAKALKKRSELCYRLNMSWIHTPDWNGLVSEIGKFNFARGKGDKVTRGKRGRGEKVTRWQDDKVTRWQGEKVTRWWGEDRQPSGSPDKVNGQCVPRKQKQYFRSEGHYREFEKMIGTLPSLE